MILLYSAYVFFVLFVIGFIGGLIYACKTEASAIWSAKFFAIEFVLIGLFMSFLGGFMILEAPTFIKAFIYGLGSLVMSLWLILHHGYKTYKTILKRYSCITASMEKINDTAHSNC